MNNLRNLVSTKIENLREENPIKEEELKKYYLIEEILKRDDCFFQMTKENALDILYNIGVSNPEEEYKKLITIDNY